MKFIKKLLTILAVGATLPIAATGLTTCAKNDSKYSNHVKSIVNHLVNMNKKARCTEQNYYYSSSLNNIRTYITAQAVKGGVPWENIVVDDYGNLWYDIQATPGCEQWEPLIMQAHMDMVVAGMSKTDKFVKPIDTVVEWDKGIVHSRDYKTSLGADNGFGVATLLTITQDTSIKHGPLRMVFTANEDSGMIGASYIAENNFDVFVHLPDKRPILYALNIDGEDQNQIYRSCNGSVTYNFDCQYVVAIEAALANQVYIDIKGLNGGHSGDNVPLGYANAEKLSFMIANELIKEGKSIQIVQNYHPDDEGKDVEFSRNQIVNHSRLQFRSDADAQTINTLINRMMPQFKETYKVEDWTKVSIKSVDDSQSTKYNKFMSTTDSSTFINKLGTNIAPDGTSEAQNIWYGWKELANIGVVSQNISPLNIKLSTHVQNRIDVELRSQIRTVTNKGLSTMDQFYQNFELNDQKGIPQSRYPAWEKTEKNDLIDIVVESYKKHGVTPTLKDENGGVEPTFWVKCNPKIQTTAIGPQIDHAHNTKETLHIDTIQMIVDVVLDTIKAMNK